MLFYLIFSWLSVLDCGGQHLPVWKFQDSTLLASSRIQDFDIRVVADENGWVQLTHKPSGSVRLLDSNGKLLDHGLLAKTSGLVNLFFSPGGRKFGRRTTPVDPVDTVILGRHVNYYRGLWDQLVEFTADSIRILRESRGESHLWLGGRSLPKFYEFKYSSDSTVDYRFFNLSVGGQSDWKKAPFRTIDISDRHFAVLKDGALCVTNSGTIITFRDERLDSISIIHTEGPKTRISTQVSGNLIMLHEKVDSSCSKVTMYDLEGKIQKTVLLPDKSLAMLKNEGSDLWYFTVEDRYINCYKVP